MNGTHSRRLPGTAWPGHNRPTRLSACHSLQLAALPQQVAGQLFDLGQLPRWWPGVRRVLALPGGVRSSGDLAVLEGPHGDQLLRVVRYRPGRGLLLLISAPGETLHLELALRPLSAGTLLLLRAEIAAPASLLRRAWQDWRLRCRASQARRALERRFGRLADAQG